MDVIFKPLMLQPHFKLIVFTYLVSCILVISFFHLTKHESNNSKPSLLNMNKM